MPRFFTSDISGETAWINGDDARHITKVLRMRQGESVTVCDLCGTDYDCEITGLSPETVTLKILARYPCVKEPAVKIRLYQALPKGDKLEFIVQKAVELGVLEIVPVITEYCISRWDEKTAGKKTGRLQKIALEAAKQCGRGIVPGVLPVMAFEKAVLRMKTDACAILFYERETKPLSGLLSGGGFGDISVMVGSEGGFSQEEAAFARAQGIETASLGARILRCETAPLVALSAILYAGGEL